MRRTDFETDMSETLEPKFGVIWLPMIRLIGPNLHRYDWDAQKILIFAFWFYTLDYGMIKSSDKISLVLPYKTNRSPNAKLSQVVKIKTIRQGLLFNLWILVVKIRQKFLNIQRKSSERRTFFIKDIAHWWTRTLKFRLILSCLKGKS